MSDATGAAREFWDRLYDKHDLVTYREITGWDVRTAFVTGARWIVDQAENMAEEERLDPDQIKGRMFVWLDELQALLEEGK